MNAFYNATTLTYPWGVKFIAEKTIRGNKPN